jgi:hypothetical protein
MRRLRFRHAPFSAPGRMEAVADTGRTPLFARASALHLRIDRKQRP